jgi:hypothetical protein
LTCDCAAGDVVPAAMKTLGVTVTFEMSLLVSRTITPPDGAGAGKVTGSMTACPIPTVVLAGRLIALIPPPEPTCTCALAGANPLADAVIIADPRLMPFSVGARLGVIPPCGMKMSAGATFTVEGSLLASDRNTPPDGAAVASVTGNDVDRPSGTITLAARMIPDDEADTVTLALAFPKFRVFAVIVAEPAATPVTGTATLVAPAANVTVAGIVATPVLFELRLAVSPAIAGPDKFSVRLPAEPELIARLCGEKKLLPPLVITWTCPLPCVYPGADARILTNPTLMPVTCGCVAGDVVPPAMKTLGVTIALDVSLLFSVTVTPPAGAAPGKVTGSVTD